jgi:hypothetical protein
VTREIDPTLVKLNADTRDIWADLLRVNYPRLMLTGRPSSPWRVAEVVEMRARILESGELELYAVTGSGGPVTLRVPLREWSWRQGA